MWRHHPQTPSCSELVGKARWARPGRAGAFSFVLSGTSRHPPRPGARGRLADGRGLLLRQRDPAIAGEPLSLAGEEVLGPSGVDLVFAGTARCPDEVLAHFDCGFAMPYRAGIEVAGEDGVIVVRDPWHATEPGIEVRREDGVERIDMPHADSYQLELENVADAISGAAPLLLGRDDALGQARAIEALYRSAGS